MVCITFMHALSTSTTELNQYPYNDVRDSILLCVLIIARSVDI